LIKAVVARNVWLESSFETTSEAALLTSVVDMGAIVRVEKEDGTLVISAWSASAIETSRLRNFVGISSDYSSSSRAEPSHETWRETVFRAVPLKAGSSFHMSNGDARLLYRYHSIVPVF
jgi:hypothetical protein